MINVAFVIIFVLNCGLFCKGQTQNVFPPFNQSMIIVLRGSTARLEWTFKGDPSRATLFWYFTKRSTSNEEDLAIKVRTQDAIIYNSSLPDVAIENPATLVLKNVDERYNGKYRFTVTVAGAGGDTAVDFFIAAKPSVTINCCDPTTVNEGDDVTCVCQSQGGNPPANVTWYDKDDVQIGNTSYGENILTFTMMTKQDSGKYTCKAQSFILKNEKSFELIVHYKPINTTIKVPKEAHIGERLEISCASDGLFPPTFTITHNATLNIVSNMATYTKDIVQYSDAGVYTCIAKNILGNDTDSGRLIVKDKTSFNFPTSTNEWYIVVGILVSGIIIGLFLAFIIWCLHHRHVVKNRNPERKPEPQATKVDTTYQELDLSKMNTEDNYQSLKVNTATNEDDSTYTELSKTRDEENNYQSLT